MYTSSSNRRLAARKFPFMKKYYKKKKRKTGGSEKKTLADPLPPLPPPLFPSYGIVQLTVSIMWRGSHLIKLVQAVQSLKRGGSESEREGGVGGELHLRP